MNGNRAGLLLAALLVAGTATAAGPGPQSRYQLPAGVADDQRRLGSQLRADGPRELAVQLGEVGPGLPHVEVSDPGLSTPPGLDAVDEGRHIPTVGADRVRRGPHLVLEVIQKGVEGVAHPTSLAATHPAAQEKDAPTRRPACVRGPAAYGAGGPRPPPHRC